jgi:hypothetical protein
VPEIQFALLKGGDLTVGRTSQADNPFVFNQLFFSLMQEKGKRKNNETGFDQRISSEKTGQILPRDENMSSPL